MPCKLPPHSHRDATDQSGDKDNVDQAISFTQLLETLADPHYQSNFPPYFTSALFTGNNRKLLGFAASLTLPLLGLIVRELTLPDDINLEFILLFPAVLLNSLFFGTGSGLLTTIFCTTLSCITFFLPIPQATFMLRTDILISALIFLCSGGLICFCIGFIHHHFSRYILSAEIRAKSRFRAVVEMAPYALIMTDQRGRIEMVNIQAETIFGYQRSELLNQPIDILIPKRYHANHQRYFASFVDIPTSRPMGVDCHLFAQRKDGSEFSVEIGLNPLPTADGTKILAAIVDVTEKIRTEQRQRQLVNELTSINEELRNFSYVASHDLKSPLRGIDQLASWISEDLGDTLSQETSSHLQLMRKRIKRMETLLDDLLAYSQAGRSSDELVTIDTRELVRDVFELSSAVKIIHLKLADNLPVLFTRKVPLELILRNLISNAIKHHDKPEGTISISTMPYSEGIEFIVTDDGPGIPQEHQQRVFGMFQTLKPRDEMEGSGIGLALAKKTVLNVGGTMWLESDGGHGCSFHFTWPSCLKSDMPI